MHNLKEAPFGGETYSVWLKITEVFLIVKLGMALLFSSGKIFGLMESSFVINSQDCFPSLLMKISLWRL
jgi:hypothetical protein